MKIFIRADANKIIGSGHIMRCLTLANAIIKYASGNDFDRPNISFVCRHISYSLKELISHYGFDIFLLPQTEDEVESDAGFYGKWLGTSQACDANACISLMYGADFIINDHYALNSIWERAVREKTGSRIISIDDLNREHDSDILVDTTFGKTRADYEEKISDSTLALIGSRFALLRPEFAQRRLKNLKRLDALFERNAPVKNLLLSPGGMDKDNASSQILDILNQCHLVPTVHILLGADAPHLEQVKERASQMKFRTIVHAGISDVASLLSSMDLCVGASGSSTWERCCLGLPTINFTIAANQNFIAKSLSDVGAVQDGGSSCSFSSQNMSRSIDALLNSNEDRHALSLAAREVCDGLGATRVVRKIYSVFTGKEMILRPASKSDIKIVYDWQCHPETRRHFINPSPPSWEEHESWMKSRLLQTPLDFWIGWREGSPIGLIRLQEAPERFGPRAKEISILVAPEKHRQGLGAQMLSQITQICIQDDLVAHVLPTNEASRKVFIRSGFVKEGKSYLIYRGERCE